MCSWSDTGQDFVSVMWASFANFRSSILSLIGYYNVEIEVRTTTGRVDMVLKTDDTAYIFELKLNKSAHEALEQIDVKNYPERFALCGLPIVKVGINFSSKTRTLVGWAID